MPVPLRVLERPPSLPDGEEKKEKCGVFGIWGTHQPDQPDAAAQVTFAGLYAQQHRGQESAGIAVTDGHDLMGHAAMGLVNQVFKPDLLKQMHGHAAVGHVRYSTTGSSQVCNAQPLLQRFHLGPVAIAHNGNLINASRLRREYEEEGAIFQTSTDTEVIVHMLARPRHAAKADPLAHVLQHLQGAFSLVFLFPDRIEAARDPLGIRPMSLGQLPTGEYVVASETCAFDAINAAFVRDIEPGEIVTLDDRGVTSRRYDSPDRVRARCAFEHVYFANPASVLWGRNVHRVRETMGRRLAQEAPAPEADCVMPMPDSGRSAALGFAKESTLPFEEAIVPNRFVGRTFILPSQGDRDRMVSLKLNIIGELIKDREIVVVDDSIVRGTTTLSKMRALRRAGARKIHLRISCPPIRHPCYYGIDFADNKQLIATGKTQDEIADALEVDSLHYLSLEGMLDAAGLSEQNACTACWTGEYRVPVDETYGKFSFERRQLKMFS
ncbi:MAG: amidophosphoribosyltransferase [Planctomycetota bacterium]